MTVSASAWAMDTPLVNHPLHRLALLILADCTDPCGIATFRLGRTAQTACLSTTHLLTVLDEMERMGAIVALPIAGGDPDCDPLADDWTLAVFLPAIPDREPMDASHPLSGRVELPA